MTIDVYSATGTKKGSMELPADLFGAEINYGLMHQAVIMQQSNRRAPIAHVKTRGEIVGSTKKLFAQKHTGRARRGPGRSPTLRGGGKAFGPRNEANFQKDMPRKMRHAALRSCLSLQAKENRVVVIEGYPEEVKTKTMAQLLGKLPVQAGRRTLVVIPGEHRGVQLSARNIDNVKAIRAAYLNPEDVLNARSIVFLADAIKVAQDIFGKKESAAAKAPKKAPAKAEKAAEEKPAKAKKAPAKKPSTKKKSA